MSGKSTLSPADYDASINWTKRIRRERPELKKLFSPPGDRPILDAGCGLVHIRTNGTECVRVRMFDSSGSRAIVTNVNLIRDGEWRVHAMRGGLCVFDAKQLRAWCREAGLRVEEMWGSYAGEPFDPRKSTDLIIIARRSRRSA